MKYQKKPIIVEAYAVDELLRLNQDDYDALPERVRQGYENSEIMFKHNGIDVETKTGWFHADKGDYIIVGIDSEMYPCKADTFAATYEAAE
jgi:hypothetical protein